MSAENITIAGSSSKPPRRWLRFSLRFLLLFVTVIALALGWKYNRLHNQRALVAEMKRLDGHAFYDYQDERHWRAEPPGPKWLREILGDDFFADVNKVHIEGDRVTDATIEQIADCPTIKELGIGSNRITDNGVEVISRMKQLDCTF